MSFKAVVGDGADSKAFSLSVRVAPLAMSAARSLSASRCLAAWVATISSVKASPGRRLETVEIKGSYMPVACGLLAFRKSFALGHADAVETRNIMMAAFCLNSLFGKAAMAR